MTQVFRHAVASFEPTAGGVLLWTRLSGGASEVSWAVAADASFTAVVAEGRAETDATCDHTVVVDVDGLQPSTTYWYRFEV